ncbi:MAG: SDR family oxidoreductase [Betaproteobacteria bacterium]|nr:SDR family oxidoreductase [Betaproteobacteria bacterium]
MELNGSVCIVTGSSAGVGAACAVQLARKGCRVVVNYTRSETEARTTLAQCEAAGAEAILVQGDVATDADCRRIAARARERWGRIDALINNAGITKFAEADDLEALVAEDWQRIYGVNVIGAYQMIRACVPAMKSAGAGTVVNISSMAGLTGLGTSTAYVASKGALNALTLALARALAPTIRVNAVAPGLVDTRWHLDRFTDRTGYQKFLDSYKASVPLAKVANADDVASVAIWLLEGASHITGEILKVDGGRHLGKGPPRNP